MARFVIECPRCGKYTEKEAGISPAGRSTAPAAVTVDVRMDKMASRLPHCGNNVVNFDQSKARTPDTKSAASLSTHGRADQKWWSFPARQCGVRLHARRAEQRATSARCAILKTTWANASGRRDSPGRIGQHHQIRGRRQTLVWKHPMRISTLAPSLSC